MSSLDAAQLHADSLQRVCQLLAMPVVHIPVEQRECHAEIVAGLLECMIDRDEIACRMEEACSYLLLGPAPRAELATRMQLWTDGFPKSFWYEPKYNIVNESITDFICAAVPDMEPARIAHTPC